MNPPIFTSRFFSFVHNRRGFIKQVAMGVMLFTAPGAFVEQLLLMFKQIEGLFYLDHFSLDTDNDLIIVNDSLISAVGEIMHLSGRILDLCGDLLRNVLVEIWQTDNNGVYLNSHDTH